MCISNSCSDYKPSLRICNNSREEKSLLQEVNKKCHLNAVLIFLSHAFNDSYSEMNDCLDINV